MRLRTAVPILFFFYGSGDHRDLHSFPTRRSSDPAGDFLARRPGALREERPQPLAGLLRSEEHTSELQSRVDLVCRLLLEKKKLPHPRDRVEMRGTRTWAGQPSARRDGHAVHGPGP